MSDNRKLIGESRLLGMIDRTSSEPVVLAMLKLTDALEQATGERDIAEAKLAAVEKLLDTASDTRGLTWEWIDRRLGGSLYAELRAILAGTEQEEVDK